MSQNIVIYNQPSHPLKLDKYHNFNLFSVDFNHIVAITNLIQMQIRIAREIKR